MSKKIRRTPAEMEQEAEQALADMVDKQVTKPKPLRITVGDVVRAKKKPKLEAS